MSPVSPSPDFLALFRAHAEPAGTMTFARFMQLALYDPAVGYYRQDKTRIGYGRDTDFFTASTSGAVFGELVTAAVVSLLGPRDPKGFTFVEIGAEPFDPGQPGGGGILAGVAHPFGATRTVRVGEPLELTGQCVVFSNELFDAQPFRRFVFREGKWRELGVALREGTLVEVELLGAPVPALLPSCSTEGYVIDAPLAAMTLAHDIASQPWTGLFVACDYGKLWRELAESTPAGTARAYFRHRQSNQLLDRPGQQDLTCHVCWDWLSEALTRHGFPAPVLESQEAFFVHHAGDTVGKITAAEATRFSQRKLALIQLLHPAHLGQKFQVLHASRG